MFAVNKSIKYLWLRSFLIVIVCNMVIAAVFFQIVRAKVSEELNDVSSKTCSMIKDSIDLQFNKIQDLSNNIAFDPNNFYLINSSDINDFNTVKTYIFVNNLQKYLVENNYFEEIYIYYPSYDYVVGNLGSFSSQSYFILQDHGNSNSYLQIKNQLIADNKQGFQMLNIDGGQSLYYLQRMPVSENSKSYSVLYVKINKAALTESLHLSNLKGIQDFLGIIDNSGKIYASDGDANILNSIMGNVNQPIKEGTMELGKTFINAQPSVIRGLKYILVTNKWALLELNDVIFNMIILFLISSFFISLGISVYFTTRNNKPIFTLLDRFGHDSKKQNTKNEYDIIQNEIDMMLHKNSEILIHLETQQHVLQQSMIYTLVKSENKSERIISTMLSMYGMDFAYSYFLIIGIQLRGNRQFDNDVDCLTLIDLENIYGLNIIQGFVDNIWLFLVNFDDCNYHGLTEKIAKQAADSLGCPRSDLFVSVSEVHDNITEICDCYSEVLNAIDISGGEICYYHKKEKSNTGSKAIIDFNQYLMEREYTRAIELMPVLCGPYLTDVSAYLSRCRKYALINQLLEIIERDCGNGSDLYEQFSDKLFSSKNITHLKENMKEILNQLFERSKKETEELIPLYEQVKELIDINFSNPMFGLYSIADALKISNSYISRVFKQAYGYGVIEYINSIRIKTAKNLIKAGEGNIKSIAMKVGFTSDINFIRVFKKYEHTTPGKYKNC